PEHVFPTALTDVVQAYKALVSASPQPIVVAGDSAGGGLAISMMMKLRDDGVRLPKAAVLFSPWTDLAATGESMRLNEDKDAFFSRKIILLGARAFLAQARARDPRASPIYGDLAGLPPILAHVGADEVLRDDSTRLIDQARAMGVDAQIEIWPDVPHAWQLLPFLPEAAISRQKAIEFLKERLAA
ncbi:MAG: alpha/beta hydrolase fold domain-containing protein, partial [Methylocystis sp.]